MAEDNSWVFDSLVCFLHGPIWNAPLQTFIEEKSLIFEPNIQPDISNLEYHTVHNEYKNLVDYMLGSFMDEMQITPEQFEIACLEGRSQQQDNPFNFHQGLFQQIWAANDIKIFVRMMTQRNVELQLQALDLIERNQLTSATSQEDDGEASVSNDVEKKELDMSPLAVETIAKEVEKELESVEVPRGQSTDGDEKDKFERLNLFFESQKVDDDEVRSRQEYLRSQRDKIVEIKRKARSKQLSETVKKNGRPSSAQMAQKLLEGDTAMVKNSESNSASMQLRKTLAMRLRTEVVDQQ